MIFHWKDDLDKLLYLSATGQKIANLLKLGSFANYVNSNREILELRDKGYSLVVVEHKEIRLHTPIKTQIDIAKFLQQTKFKVYNQITPMINVREKFNEYRELSLDEFNIVGGNHFNQCHEYFFPDYNYRSDLLRILQKDLYIPSKFEKKVLFLSNRMRAGRYLLFSAIKHKFGFKDFFYSTFEYNSILWNKIWQEHKSFEGFFFDFKKINIDQLQDTNILKKEIFSLGKGNIPSSATLDTERELYFPEYRLYNNIFVELIQETLGDNDLGHKFADTRGIFFNEKTFKPMIVMRPFICNANRGFLKNLHSMGFKTFSKWWDESYDDQDSFYEKQDKILKILESILKKSDLELRNMLEDMKPVLLHNYNLAKRLVLDKNLWYDKENLKHNKYD